MTSNESVVDVGFDFDGHREKAISSYRNVRPRYEQLSEVAERLLKETLDAENIRYHSIQSRVKTLESFGNKVVKPSESDENTPKYSDPLNEITDLTGIRVITFLPRTVMEVCENIEKEFTVLEKTDKAAELMDEGKFGYQSVHLIVQMHPNRVILPEYKRYKGLTFEIQVRTLLQHAWAEMEHDIQYKSTVVIPNAIRRRFIALAGLLEIADREFQTLQDEDENLRLKARESVKSGELTMVEITPDALKSYLDQRIGSDGRMTAWSYHFSASLLRKIGFQTLSQVDKCIDGYDDDKISRITSGTKQGQISRFEDMLLAGLGEEFIRHHPWSSQEGFWQTFYKNKLDRLKQHGIAVGRFKLEGE